MSPSTNRCFCRGLCAWSQWPFNERKKLSKKSRKSSSKMCPDKTTDDVFGLCWNPEMKTPSAFSEKQSAEDRLQRTRELLIRLKHAPIHEAPRLLDQALAACR